MAIITRKTELRVCSKHKETLHFQTNEDGHLRWRCYACNAAGVKRHRNKKRIWSTEYLGGCCKRCGYSKYIGALEFHHRDPTEKEFQISQYQKASYEKLARELDKCDLLCANCHREAHAEMLNESPVSSAG